MTQKPHTIHALTRENILALTRDDLTKLVGEAVLLGKLQGAPSSQGSISSAGRRRQNKFSILAMDDEGLPRYYKLSTMVLKKIFKDGVNNFFERLMANTASDSDIESVINTISKQPLNGITVKAVKAAYAAGRKAEQK